MKRNKRLLSILLSAILFILPAIPAQAAQEKDESFTIAQTYVNPLYEHPEETSQHKRSGKRTTYALERETISDSMSAKTLSVAKSSYLTSDEKVADIIREGMVNREGEIEFYYKSKKKYTDEFFYNWMELAMKETDQPDEGDYIQWQYNQVNLSGSGYLDGSEEMYYYDLIFTATYHTTKAQEAKVTQRVEEVLDDIGANDAGVTNYEKTKLIYDYICENISYDMESTDKLKHTAYAALINKKAVCQGYALLLYRMLEECGIDSRIIYGTSQGELHGWNISELGSTYYLLDSTWDAGEAEYSYFLKGENNFLDHTTESKFLSDYNLSSADYDASKPAGEIRFKKETSYVDYTGKTVAADKENVEVVRGNKNFEFRYFMDEKCSEPVSAPVKVGTYYVKAVVAENSSYQYTESENVLKLIVRPARVGTLDAVNKYNGVQLTWTKRAEADGYIIYKRMMDTEYEELTRIGKNSILTYLDKDIKQGKKFLYNIVAYKNIDGEQIKSLKRSNARQIVRATVKSLTNQNGSVKVTWTKVPDAAGYKIYRKASGYETYGLSKTVKSGSTTSYTDKNAKSIRNGKASYYYVVPYYSYSSNVVLRTNTKTNYYMTRPTFSTLETDGSGALKATWKKNAKASGYQIRYSLNSDMSDAKTVSVSSGSTLSKKISALKKSKIYYVQVRAYKTYNDIKYYSSWSVKKSKKTKS